MSAPVSQSSTVPLWTACEAHAAAGGELVGDWSVGGVSIDSRSLEQGDLFIALKDLRDGHDFVPAAFAAGAAACLVERDMQRPGLIVPDVQAALEKLGLAARARTGSRCAAVTGSAGKTSVKEMLARIFRAAGRAHWSDKSFNNHWGVPLTLARMSAATERAIFEIGMNTPGEIAPRSRMVRPHVAMITRISAAHLEGMGSVEAVADEKGDIFAGLESGGAAILPADDAHFGRLQDHARRLQPSARLFTFGMHRATAHAAPVSYQSDGASSEIEVTLDGQTVRTRIDAVGEHWALNAALALLAASLMDVPAARAAEALAGYAPPAGRGVTERLPLPEGGEAILVDDSYNANPDSMRAAIEGLSRRPGRRIVVLGEMRELGPTSADLHAALAAPLKQAGVAMAILSGAGMAPLAEAIKHMAGMDAILVDGPAAASESVNTRLRSGDVVLIKGSNASGMHRVAAALRERGRAALDSQKASGVSDVV